MKFKILLILLTFLLLECSAFYPDYDEEGAIDSAASKSDTAGEFSPANEDIQEPAALQQEVEANDRKFDNFNPMDMSEVESETEMTTGKNVRNISDNQLSQEYASMEHNNNDDNDHQQDANESTESELATAPAANDSKIMDMDMDMEEEVEVDTNSSKKLRMGRLLTTTSVPEYVRKTKTSDDHLNQSQESLNLSISDYIEEDQENMKKSLITPLPRVATKHHHHDKDDDDDDEDIVPSAMKYYDVDDAVDGDNHQHHDDDDYNEHGNGNGVTKNNGPVPMPRQHLLTHNTRHQHEQTSPQQQQNSSEEYYDEDPTASREDDASVSSTTTATTAINHQTDDNLMRAIFPGFPLTFNPTTTAPSSTSAAIDTSSSTTSTTITTIDSSTLASVDSLVTPMILQFDPTTSAPVPNNPHHMLTSAMAAAAAAAAAPSLPGDKKGKHIPIIPSTTSSTSSSPASSSTTTTSATSNTGGGGGGSSHSRRRLLPHEQLRNYIEDAYIRMPLAVIVDPSTDSLEKTKSLWNDALRTNLNIKIVLVTLNESDVPAAFNFNNTRQFLTGLNSIKEHEGGDAFRGISHAAELVPYDSAVFISTATLANHTDQVHDAAITLLKKRIRLYLIWFGERALSENETQETVGGILGEVAIRSGGEVLHIVGSENSQELEGSTLTIIADAFRGAQEVDVPVDTTLSSLHVKIDKLMRRAVLETPNGEINLKKLVKFKSRLMMSPADDKRLDAYVPLTKLRKATVYKLKMIPVDLDSEYSVFIRGERKADTFLDDMIKHFETYFYEGQVSYPARFRNSKLQSITSALAIATVPTHSQLRFPDDKNEIAKTEPKDEVETFSTQEIHKNTEDESVPVVVNRTSTAAIAANTMLSQRSINVLQRSNTKIEMSIHSQVLIAPGMMGQLYFEVTNTGCESIYYNIQVVDEMRYLMKLAPQSLFLRAGQMATVTVTVLVTQSAESGTIDHITFSTTGGGYTTSLSLNLKVMTTLDAQDNTSPSLSWDFGGRCESYAFDSASCSERFWSMYVTAQDWQTGILRLQATPNAGLVYNTAYTIGSTEPLKATYIASCCDPKMSLVAYDVAGNQRSYSIDVRDLVLNEASIAAITLGAILLLLIIILIIAAIVWCCRKRKVVLDLPTYRSHSTRSME